MKAPLPTSGVREGSLDGLRGLAALWVLLTHATYAGLLPSIFNFRGSGRGGVIMFFFLSAYLISGPFFREPQTAMTWRSWASYAIRRFLRVAPLYYITIILFFVLHLDPFQNNPPLSKLWQHIDFERGDSVFWTVAVEMKFYCFLPVFVIVSCLILAKMKDARRSFWVAAAILAGSWVLGLLPVGSIMKMGINKHAPIFAAGVLTAVALSCLPRHEPSRRARIFWESAAWLSVVTYVCLSIPALYYAIVRGDSLATYSASSQEYERFWDLRIPWIGMVLGFLFFSIHNASTMLGRILASAPLAWLGRVSFGLYLVHAVILQLSHRVGLPASIEFVVALGAALGIAWLAHLGVEKPFMEIGKRLTRKIENRAGTYGTAVQQSPESTAQVDQTPTVSELAQTGGTDAPTAPNS
jgi:peptidoglycan/LPS O-acetylase OafA/YrhL